MCPAEDAHVDDDDEEVAAAAEEEGAHPSALPHQHGESMSGIEFLLERDGAYGLTGRAEGAAASNARSRTKKPSRRGRTFPRTSRTSEPLAISFFC